MGRETSIEDQATYLFKQILSECNEDNKEDVAQSLAEMFVELKSNYDHLARILTKGEYNETWNHKRLMEYVDFKYSHQYF